MLRVTTNDYVKITDLNTTKDNNNNNNTENCSKNETFFDIFIPTLLLTIPCGLSFLHLKSSMIYTLIKPLMKLIIKL